MNKLEVGTRVYHEKFGFGQVYGLNIVKAITIRFDNLNEVLHGHDDIYEQRFWNYDIDDDYKMKRTDGVGPPVLVENEELIEDFYRDYIDD